jgi:hypothetical protein
MSQEGGAPGLADLISCGTLGVTTQRGNPSTADLNSTVALPSTAKHPACDWHAWHQPYLPSQTLPYALWKIGSAAAAAVPMLTEAVIGALVLFAWDRRAE